jgi:6-phosphogluconolactonase
MTPLSTLRTALFTLCTAIGISFCLQTAVSAGVSKPNYLFVGTYTSGSSLGIYLFKMDTVTGALTQVATSPTGKAPNPSYLVIHPNKKWIYAVCEQAPGSVNAFSYDSSKKQMTFLNSVQSKGDAPCYVSVDNAGKNVLVSNYGTGTVAVLPINADGSLAAASSTDQHSGTGPVSGWQGGPHAHSILQAANGFVYGADLGVDKVFIYKLDAAAGKLTSAGVDAATGSGAGPRHLAFHPTQPWLYVACQLSDKVEAYTVNNTTGALTKFQTVSSLPTGTTGATGVADIHGTPDGKFLYVSNRESFNNIAIYSINQTNGNLTFLGVQAAGGNNPRNFVIDPTGTFLFVASQDGSKIISFKINATTGLLTATGLTTTVPNPVCLKFLPADDASPVIKKNLSASIEWKVSAGPGRSIVYVLPRESQVSIMVYDTRGTLLFSSAEKQTAGTHKMSLSKNRFHAGRYLLTIKTGTTGRFLPFTIVE